MLLAFDLDGVLYSSEPFLGAAYEEAIRKVNARRPGAFSRVPTTAEILAHVGWTIPTIFANLFPDADDAALEDLHGETLDVICRRVAAREGELFAGVPETLRALRAAGHILCVASNGRTRYVETVLATYGIDDVFEPRVTADMVGDKLSILRFYRYRFGLPVEQVVMVGDRASDVEAAQAIGCAFIGCDYGHGHRNEIEHAGRLVQRFEDLPRTIATLLGMPEQG